MCETESVMYSIVAPVYNEELVLPEFYRRTAEVLNTLCEPYELIFVNDGSRDKSLSIINEICKKNENVKLIDFSRNFGHQLAITAGMDHARGKAVIIIDADLQDPPETIVKMIEKWKEGYEVVYGKRLERRGESFLKRMTAAVFYRFLRRMTDVDIPVDTGDFRLIDRKVCDTLKSLNERNRYIRGLISWVGFRQIGVEFTRNRRFAGETKYPLKKMLVFALDAITSFSYKPLKLASYTGIAVSISSFVYLLVVLYEKIFTNKTIQGWASTLAVNLLFNGIVLMILGIVGEYIGRIYDEAKGRPLYVVRNLKNFDKSTENERDA